MRSIRIATAVGLGAVLGLGLVVQTACKNDKTFGPFVPTTASAPTPVPPNLPPTPPPRVPGPNPPFLRLKVSPNPAVGKAPLDVTFNACKSFDPDGDKLTFAFNYGDGKEKDADFCRQTHTYSSVGDFKASVCATDGRTETCRSVSVSVS